MKILVCSDSHGDYARLFRAHEAAGATDLTIHLGDGSDDARLLEEVLECPVAAVAGNCDLGSTLPAELLLTLEGERILAVHGHRFGVKGGLSRLAARAREVGAAVVLYGHTHLPAMSTDGAILFLNPGPIAAAGCYAVLTVNPGDPPEAALLTLPPLEPGA